VAIIILKRVKFAVYKISPFILKNGIYKTIVSVLKIHLRLKINAITLIHESNHTVTRIF